MKFESNVKNCRYMPCIDTDFYKWLASEPKGINIGVCSQAISHYLDFQSVRDSIDSGYFATLRAIHNHYWYNKLNKVA